VILRRARREDVPAIVDLLRDDELGSGRESPAGETLPDSYFEAFETIDRDPSHELIVGEFDGRVVATLQLMFLTHLASRGGTVGQIESVHVHSSLRGRGLGAQLVRAAIARCEARGCRRVQLTSNKVRKDAHRFYERLGFRATHEGMKLPLQQKV
jgi:GNAT superfamily N-acetyltransferase